MEAGVAQPAGKSLIDHLAALKDPRQAWKVVCPLTEILLVVLCGTLAGAEDFVEIRRWAMVNRTFLRRFLPFRHGIPSHDTLNALDGELFAVCFSDWVASLAEAEVERGGNSSRERRCHLSSMPLDARLFARAARCHWHVENRLHRVLDVVFHEDLNRLRSGCGPRNMVTVRHMALNLLRSASDKHSLKVRRKSAAWDTDCLNALLRRSA